MGRFCRYRDAAVCGRLCTTVHGNTRSRARAERGGDTLVTKRPLIGDRGFTVVEFVAAAAILLIIAMGVMSVFGYATQASQNSAVRVDALNLANERLELVRNLPYDEVGVINADGTPPDIPGAIETPVEIDGEYVVDTDVSWARDPDTGRALYKEVLVTVRWGEDSGSRVQLSSNIFGKSSLVNTGDLSVLALDAETNAAMTGVAVVITPVSGAARSTATDDAGEAFYGYLSTGEYQLQCTKAGYIYDYAALSSVNVAADLLTSVVVRLQRPSSARITVVDDSDVPIPGATVTLSRSGAPDRTATTSVSGAVDFDDLLIADYTATAVKDGYSQGSITVAIPAGGQALSQTIKLTARRGLVVRTSDSADVPVSGVTVNVRQSSWPSSHVSGSPLITSASGEVAFEGLANATYSVTVEKAGYTTQNRSVTYDGSNAPEVFVMAPIAEGSLLVRTVNNNGNARGGQSVRITGPDSYYLTGRTDSDGYLLVKGLQPGTYEVQYYRLGWQYQKQTSVTVSAGMQTYQELSW